MQRKDRTAWESGSRTCSNNKVQNWENKLLLSAKGIQTHWWRHVQHAFSAKLLQDKSKKIKVKGITQKLHEWNEIWLQVMFLSRERSATWHKDQKKCHKTHIPRHGSRFWEPWCTDKHMVRHETMWQNGRVLAGRLGRTVTGCLCSLPGGCCSIFRNPQPRSQAIPGLLNIWSLTQRERVNSLLLGDQPLTLTNVQKQKLSYSTRTFERELNFKYSY